MRSFLFVLLWLPGCFDWESLSPAGVADLGAPGPRDGSFCGRQVAHAFCDDFDTEIAGAFTLWDGVQSNGGLLAYTSQAVSPPNALEVHVNAGAGVGPSLTKNFSVATTIHVEFDVRATCASAESDLVSIKLVPTAGSQVSAIFYQSPATAHITIGCTGSGQDAAACNGDVSLTAISLANWQHFVLDVDLGTRAFAVSFPATDAGTRSVGLPLPSLPQSAFALVIGVASHAQLAVPCLATFDNVVVDGR